MKKWMLISAERHRNFENAVRAKDRHHLNLEAFSLVDNKFNNDKKASSDIVKEIQKLNDLYKDGVLTKDEFEKERREKKRVDNNTPKFNFTKFNKDNIIIDVDCEIIEETNDRRKYLSIENKDH